MELTIKKKLSWYKVYLVQLDENKMVCKEERLRFDEDHKARITINEQICKFIYFTDYKRKSEVVVLSKNLDELVLYYNRRTKFYTLDLNLQGVKDYGHVDTYELEDKKNLFFLKNHKKRIHVYTPSNYDENKTYSLMLMFDSQNLFNQEKVNKYTNKNDPYKGWQVETTLESIKRRYDKEYIVVGIDNSDSTRTNELMPNSKNFKYRKECLEILGTNEDCYFDDLINFILETVFPFVESKYHFNQEDRLICGSSCGGLASLYMGLKVPNFFSYILTFTPAIGFGTDQETTRIYKEFMKKQKKSPEIYFYQGSNELCELEVLLSQVNENLVDNLIEAGVKPRAIHTYHEENAYHNEDYWRYAFSFFLEEIFSQK